MIAPRENVRVVALGVVRAGATGGGTTVDRRAGATVKGSWRVCGIIAG